MYQWAIDTCNDPNVGYSQDYRNQQTVGGKTYYDCSSFIWYALLAGNFNCVYANHEVGGEGEPFATNYLMRDTLEELGWTRYRAQDVIWRPGDILWRSGHTEMVFTGVEGERGRGRTMGAHSSSKPFADQVSIYATNSSSTYWSKLYRYEEPDAIKGANGGATNYPLISIHVLCAILGNWAWESNINPGIWEGLNEPSWADSYDWSALGIGYGLGQWTNTQGSSRLNNFRHWQIAKQTERWDGYAQIEYMKHENIWYQASFAIDFPSLTAFLNSQSTDIDYLTKAFYSGWEGLNTDDGSLSSRIQWAHDIYNYLQGISYDDEITWITGNRYLNTSEVLHNAQVVYQYMCTLDSMHNTSDPVTPVYPPINPSDPGGDDRPWSKKKMPIWMYIRRKTIW